MAEESTGAVAATAAVAGSPGTESGGAGGTDASTAKPSLTRRIVYVLTPWKGAILLLMFSGVVTFDASTFGANHEYLQNHH